jgi:murein DD-endopeptidase MepM/ murein hydrolase activator NlpD
VRLENSLNNGTDKKSVTFLVVSNRKGTTHKLVVSAAWLKAGLSLAIVAAVIASACIVDYVGLLSQSIENRQLRTENMQLKQQFQVVEGKLNSLETGLERVKGFVTKLRLITNVESDDRTLKLAIGPLPRTGQSVQPEEMNGEDGIGEPADDHDEGERQPASAHGVIVPPSDALFVQRPPADELQGELTVEGQRDYGSLAIRIDQAVQETAVRETGILELWETLSERQSLLAATPSIKPVRGWFTSKFGYRISPFTQRPVMHNGLDIAAAPGTPIQAPADGIVSFAGYDPGYGKLVSIDHGYGVVTRFGHTSQIFVEVGQHVHRRDVIAAVGNTGRSTGPHCHYEVRVNSVPVDPFNYVLDDSL